MAVEIRELVVRTTISGSSREQGGQVDSGNSMEELKREVLAVCMEWLADYLERQKER